MKAHLRVSTLLATAALLAASSVATSAHAAGHGDANGFGEKSELIISADRLVPLFSFTRVSRTDTDNNVELTDSRTGTGLSLLFGRNVGISEDFLRFPVNVHTLPRVAGDFTIIPRLTIGAAIAFGFGLGGTDKNESVQGGQVITRSTDSPRATAIGLVPRVGYILPLGDILAFWPRLGFGFYSVSAKQDTIDNNGAVTQTTSLTDTLFSLDLDPQLAIVPTEHFFFHVGPIINIPLSGRRSVEITQGATTRSVSNDVALFHFGITAGIGGWINL